MDKKVDYSRNSGNRIKQFNKLLQADHLGKLPPQAIDIEQAVLGALMLEKNAISKAIDILKPDSFYEPKHQFIYAAIRELFATTNPVDIITVTNYLRTQG